MDSVTILGFIILFRYWILIPAALLWGLLVCMVSGVAIRLGFLDLIPAYACLMLGELMGDMLWYWTGYRFGGEFARRYGKYVGVTPTSVGAATKLFRRYNQRILFASKLTTGFGFAIPILFTAGLSRVSFRDYMIANISGQFFWTGGLIAIGYFFGDFYLKVNSTFEKMSVFAAFVIVFLCMIGLTKYCGSRIRRKLHIIQ